MNITSFCISCWSWRNTWQQNAFSFVSQSILSSFERHKYIFCTLWMYQRRLKDIPCSLNRKGYIMYINLTKKSDRWFSISISFSLSFKDRVLFWMFSFSWVNHLYSYIQALLSFHFVSLFVVDFFNISFDLFSNLCTGLNTL